MGKNFCGRRGGLFWLNVSRGCHCRFFASAWCVVVIILYILEVRPKSARTGGEGMERYDVQSGWSLNVTHLTGESGRLYIQFLAVAEHMPCEIMLVGCTTSESTSNSTSMV